MIAALLILPSLPVPSSAQTNAARDVSSRYLFIVDTSAAMKRCGPAAQKAVENLLRSSLNAQLQPGDTVGVWTFDEELNAGRFPLQNWSPEQAAAVASNVVAFLRAQPNQKTSRYEVVAPELEQLVQDSYKLTVLLVTDGDEKISGTPFDREIQTNFVRNFKIQQRARMPFITVLRASRGQIRSASVNLAPWPVEFPTFPPEPRVVAAPPPKPPETAPAPRPAVPPPATNAPATANTDQAESASVVTNAPVKIETAISPATPVTPPSSPIEIKPLPAPTPSPASNEIALQPKTTTVTPPAPTPDSSTPPTVLPVTRAPAEATKPPPSAIVENKPSPAAVKPPAEAPIASPPATAVAEPAPVPVSPAAPPPAATDSPANEPMPTNPPAPVTLAVQPEPGFGRLSLAGIGVAVLLLTGGFFFVLQRRARNATHASLITRSFDRDRK